MSVELGHTLSSHHADLSSSVLSKASSLPLCSAGTMSKHSSTFLAVGFTVNPLRSPSCTLRSRIPRKLQLSQCTWLPHRLLRCCCELISGTCLLAEVQEGAVGISIGAAAVGIPSSRRDSGVGPGIPESIVSRRLHCSPGDLHSSKPCFVPTRCSSDDACPHQQCDDSKQILVNLDNKSSKWNDR